MSLRGKWQRQYYKDSVVQVHNHSASSYYSNRQYQEQGRIEKVSIGSLINSYINVLYMGWLYVHNLYYLNKSVMDDQRPLPKTGTYNLDQLPQIQNDNQQDTITNQPISKRILSKNFKHRLSAYIQLLDSLHNQQELQQKYNFEAFLKDNNPQCLEKAIHIYELWINSGAELTENGIHLLVENGAINGKGSGKIKAGQLILDFFQKKPQVVDAAIQKGMTGKVMKVVAGWINLLTQILKQFGPKKLNYLKNYYGTIQKFASGTNSQLKSQCMNLYKEAIMFIGKQVVDSQTTKLKDAQKKQLDQFQKNWDKVVPQPPRGEKLVIKGNGPAKKIDAYDIAEAVDISKKFNQKWSQKVLKEQKWNQKTKLLDQFIGAVSVPKLANFDIKHITEMIKRLINDNFNVVIRLLKIIGLLSKGLRKHYSGTAKIFFFDILCKFRDKKTIMQDQTKSCLDQTYFSLSIQDVVEPLKQALADKTPSMKIQTLAFIQRFLNRKKQEKGELPDKTKQCLLSFGPQFQKLINDGVAEVRDYTVGTIGRIKLITQDQSLDFLQNKMSKNLIAKMREAQQKVQVKQVKKKDKKQQQKKEQRRQQRKEQRKEQRKFQRKEQIQQKKTIISTFELLEKKESQQQPDLGCSSQESEQILINKGIKEDIFKKLQSNTYKDRLDALVYFKQLQLGDDLIEHVLKVLKRKTNNWKQSNLPINKQLMLMIMRMAQNKVFNRRCFLITVGFFIDKLNDNKFIQNCIKYVQILAKIISPKYIIGVLLKNSKQQKKGKLPGDMCAFLTKLSMHINLENYPVRQCAELINQSIQNNTNKKYGVDLLKKLHQQYGNQLKQYLEGNSIKIMESQIKQVKKVDEEKQLGNQINKLMPKLQSNDFKTRKEAIQILDKLIDDGRIKVHNQHPIGELFRILKQRVTDNNKSLAKLHIAFLGKLFQILKQAKAYWKIISNSLISTLSDKSPLNRMETISAINRISKVVPSQSIISSMHFLAETENAQIRIEMMKWILDNEDGFWKCQYSAWLKNFLMWLSDRNKQIRDLSQMLIQRVFHKLGINIIVSSAKDMKPVYVQQINSLINKFMGDKPIVNKSMERRQIDKCKSPSVKEKERSVQRVHKKEKQELDFQVKNIVSPESQLIELSRQYLKMNLSPSSYNSITHFNIEQFSKSLTVILVQDCNSYMGALFYFIWTRLWGCSNSYVVQSSLSFIYKKLGQYQKNDQSILTITLSIVKQISLWFELNIYGDALAKLCSQLLKKYNAEAILGYLLEHFQKQNRPHIKKQCSKEILKHILKKTIVTQLSPASLTRLAKIQEIRKDQQITQVLYTCYNKKVLEDLGFFQSKALTNYSNINRQNINPGGMAQSNLLAISQQVIKPSVKKLQNPYNAPKSGPLTLLQVLYPPNFQRLDQQKQQIVKIFNKSTYTENQLLKYSKYAMEQIYLGAVICFQRRNQIGIDRIHDYLAVMQRGVHNQPFVKAAGEVSFNLVHILLKELLYQDENKQQTGKALRSKGIQTTAQGLIKLINNISLRLLDNSPSNQIMLYLLTLYNSHKLSAGRFPTLLLKCIKKLNNQFVQNIQNANVTEFLTKIHQCLIDCQQTSAKIFVEMVVTVAKYLGESIWTYYECSIENHKVPDKYIGPAIQNLGIPYPQQQQQFDQLKQYLNTIIIQKDIEGIYQLRKYLEKNTRLDLKQYMTAEGYPQRQIALVMSKLEKRPSLKKSFYDDKNITTKILDLKQKFHQMNSIPVLQRMQNGDQQKASQQQMRQRLQQVRNKYNRIS